MGERSHVNGKSGKGPSGRRGRAGYANSIAPVSASIDATRASDSTW